MYFFDVLSWLTRINSRYTIAASRAKGKFLSKKSFFDRALKCTVFVSSDGELIVGQAVNFPLRIQLRAFFTLCQYSVS